MSFVSGNNNSSAVFGNYAGPVIWSSNVIKMYVGETGGISADGAAPTGTADVTITNTGNVGIGTTTPTTKLQVEGGYATIGDSYIKLLLHADGSDASTTFKDETGKTVTANGNAQIDVAQSKFGGASGLFDGAGDYLSLADNDDWNFGSGDFTIECQYNPDILPSSQNDFDALYSQYVDASNYVWLTLYYYNSQLLIHFRYQKAGSSVINCYADVTGDITIGAWNHIAVVRNGSQFWGFINGVAHSMSTNATAIDNLAAGIQIGAWNGGYAIDGWIDEFRVSKGIARWTSAFTPATSAYLCDNVLYGNVIIPAGNVGIGTTSPGATLDVAGTVQMFGAWETKAINTVYQAASDGFIVIHILDGTVSIYTDNSTPPTTRRLYVAGTNNPGDRRGAGTCPVRKGDYWKIGIDVTPADSFIYWISLGH